MREKHKSKLKFRGAKVDKAQQVRKYFINPEIENEVFGQCKITLFVVWISEIQKQLFADIHQNGCS